MNQSSIDHAKKYPGSLWGQMIARSIELSFLSHPDWSLDSKKIKQAAEHGTLVLDCSTDPFNGHEKFVKDRLSKVIDDFYILTGDTDYLDNPDDRIIYYPTFYVEIIEGPRHPQTVLAGDRAHFLGCLNGRSRIHRIENYVKLKTKPYWPDCVFRIHRHFDYALELKECDDDFCHHGILDDYLKSQSSLPQRSDNNDLTSLHPAYTSCYVNLVTETSVGNKQVFLSEKTFKPFTTGQFALWLASPGTVSRLRKFGFDMFDDIIDHRYDLEPNWHTRIDMIHAELDRLYTLNINRVFQEMYQRRIDNFNWLYSDKLHGLMLSQVNVTLA